MVDAEYFHGLGKYSIELMLKIFTDLENNSIDLENQNDPTVQILTGKITIFTDRLFFHWPSKKTNLKLTKSVYKKLLEYVSNCVI